MWNMLWAALYAAITAGIIAGGGYLKNTPLETFEKVKFLKTILLAIGFSLGAELTGLTPDAFSAGAIGTALSVGVENLFKALWRRKEAIRDKVGI